MLDISYPSQLKRLPFCTILWILSSFSWSGQPKELKIHKIERFAEQLCFPRWSRLPRCELYSTQERYTYTTQSLIKSRLLFSLLKRKTLSITEFRLSPLLTKLPTENAILFQLSILNNSKCNTQFDITKVFLLEVLCDFLEVTF